MTSTLLYFSAEYTWTVCFCLLKVENVMALNIDESDDDDSEFNAEDDGDEDDFEEENEDLDEV